MKKTLHLTIKLNWKKHALFLGAENALKKFGNLTRHGSTLADKKSISRVSPTQCRA